MLIDHATNTISPVGTANDIDIVLKPKGAGTTKVGTNAIITAADVVTSPAANKILRMDGNSKLPADITGNAATATVASAAYCADYAEIFTCRDAVEIPTGTVVCVSDDEFEVEQCNDKHSLGYVGVVSDNPGHVINWRNADGCEYAVVIAEVGKVPVRVIGPVKKKDPLVIAGNGCAKRMPWLLRVMSRLGRRPNTIGNALETNLDTKEKLVYSLVGR